MRRQEKPEQTFASASAVPECDSVSAIDTSQTLYLLPSLVRWNCRVRRFGPLGMAGLSAQRGHIPFGLKEGCARCTTS
jgi:hypothetical protein